MVTHYRHTHTYIPTYTHDNYYNPRCACAPRVNEQRSRDTAAKKLANTSGVGKSNNYYIDSTHSIHTSVQGMDD